MGRRGGALMSSLYELTGKDNQASRHTQVSIERPPKSGETNLFCEFCETIRFDSCSVLT